MSITVLQHLAYLGPPAVAFGLVVGYLRPNAFITIRRKP